MPKYILIILLITGCSMPVVNKIPNSQSLLNRDMIGQTWMFKNSLGDITTISIEESPNGTLVKHPNKTLVFHYTKSADRTYWFPGQHAELWFPLELRNNGWYASAVIYTCNTCLLHAGVTQATVEIDTKDVGYLILPNQFKDYIGSYTPFYQLGVISWDKGDRAHDPWADSHIKWQITSYMEDVITPIYSGPAIVSEQREGCNTSGCAHEKWYFAPKIGIVKIVQITNGINTDPQIGILERFK